jgi:hypothetical protein
VRVCCFVLYRPDEMTRISAPTMSPSSFKLMGLGDLPPYKSDTSSDYPSETDSPTVFMPVMRPPTPAPSPRPISPALSVISLASSLAPQVELPPFQALLDEFQSLGPISRKEYLASLLAHCSSRELFFISTRIAPLLKRDFLADLPLELSLHILSFVDHPRTLARVACVSRKWYALVQDEQAWRGLASAYHLDPALHGPCEPDTDESDTIGVTLPHVPNVLTLPRLPRPPRAHQPAQSSQALFKYAWSTCMFFFFPWFSFLSISPF